MPIPQLRTKHIGARNHSISTHQKNESPFNKKRLKKSNKNLLKIGVLLLIGGSTLAIAVFANLIQDLPDPTKINERNLAESTIIYDRTGEHILFQFFGDEKRTFLNLENIPESVREATLVAEDRDFYSHGGLKITSIIRSMLSNIIEFDLKGQGGSTITQQFVKNAILSSEKTYTRKIKEAVLAWQMEKKFTKDQILELYLNEIPYGSTAYGIEAAAQNYFNKKTEELTLAESAILAALPKAPTFYSPYGNNKDELIGRQQFILNGMVEEGYITDEEAEGAKQQELEFKPKQDDITAPHFVFWLKEKLAEKYGERVLEQGGLKIISTIDLDLQKKAENILAEQVEKNTENYDATNAALVALDPKTGHILSMVGSKDYFDLENDGNVNVAARPRQPGSSFKPIVYAAAFTKGFTPETKVFDVRTNFKTELGVDYSPVNYDESERGVISLRHALAGSLNIPAVKVLYLTGIDSVLNLAKSLGYSTLEDRSRFGLSLVLGGGEIKLVEHASAFGAFSQDGVHHPTTGVLKIEDREGKIIEEYKEQTKKVIDTEVARIINAVLSSPDDRAYVFGYNSALTIPGRQAAAKTGTTNKFIDSWTMGYSPQMVVGVWVGNNDNTPMRVGAYGGTVAAPIWKQFMIEAHSGLPVENFTPPKEITGITNKVLLGEGFGETTVTIDRISGKLATEFTPEEFRVEQTYFSPHSILFYINKDNPNGPPPESPENDIQFTSWEEAIQIWAEKNEFLLEEPPTEYDDVHLPEFAPKVTIISPNKNQVITNNTITARANASGKNSAIDYVDFQIDGRTIGRVNRSPYEIEVNLNDFINGWHTFSARAFDMRGNVKKETITFQIELKRTEPGLTWIAPQNQQVISLDTFPLELKIQTPTPELLNTISVHAINIITGETITIDENINLNSNQEKTILWQKEGLNPGNWQLRAILNSSITKPGPTLLINPEEEKQTSEQ